MSNRNHVQLLNHFIQHCETLLTLLRSSANQEDAAESLLCDWICNRSNDAQVLQPQHV